MIEITSIRQPASGAVMLIHCDKCKATTIVVNEYAIKPEHGDAWKLSGCCIEFPLHNLDWLALALRVMELDVRREGRLA